MMFFEKDKDGLLHQVPDDMVEEMRKTRSVALVAGRAMYVFFNEEEEAQLKIDKEDFAKKHAEREAQRQAALRTTPENMMKLIENLQAKIDKMESK